MTNPTPNTQTAPEGYVMNAKGHYVPLSGLPEYLLSEQHGTGQSTNPAPTNPLVANAKARK